LPQEDRRTKLSPVKALLVLLRNLLVSREPIYGVGEWAARHAPDLLGLTPAEIGLLNDDRVGRALDKLFAADVPSLVLSANRSDTSQPMPPGEVTRSPPRPAPASARSPAGSRLPSMHASPP
jgi:hypothetical protein